MSIIYAHYTPYVLLDIFWSFLNLEDIQGVFYNYKNKAWDGHVHAHKLFNFLLWIFYWNYTQSEILNIIIHYSNMIFSFAEHAVLTKTSFHVLLSTSSGLRTTVSSWPYLGRYAVWVHALNSEHAHREWGLL